MRRLDAEDIGFHNRGLPPLEISPRHDAGWRWPLLLLSAWCLCFPVLLVGIHTEQSGGWHERMSLKSSHHTWLRMHSGEARAWLIPTVREGQPRVEKPPLVVWLNLLAWTGLEPETATAQTLVVRSRLVGVALGLMTLTGIFWICCMIGDARMGFIAAVIAGTLFFFQRYARMNTYDIAMVAGATMSVACALWAMGIRSLPPGKGRAALGWGLCGVFLAMAWLSKGPLSLVIVIFALLATIAVLPVRRGPRLLACMAAVGVAAAMALPWYWYLAESVARVTDRLAVEYTGPPWDVRPPWFYIQRIGISLPWTLWLIAGLVHPFVRARGHERRIRLIAWLWFVSLLAFFSLAPPKVPRYLLPLVPASAIIAAQVWRDQIAFAERGERDRGAAPLLHGHWLSFAVATLVLGFATLAHGWLVEREMMQPVDHALPSALATVGLTLGLLGLAMLGWYLHRRWKPMHASVIAAIWCAVVGGAYWYLQQLSYSAGDASAFSFDPP